MTGTKKIPLGSPVIIDTITGKYTMKDKINKNIALMPEGIVTAYCNELSGEFLIVRLRSNIEIKVTENELSNCTRNYYFSKKIVTFGAFKRIIDYLKTEFIFTGNRNIKYLINPFNFLKWIRYTMKDVL